LSEKLAGIQHRTSGSTVSLIPCQSTSKAGLTNEKTTRRTQRRWVVFSFSVYLYRPVTASQAAIPAW
jgi:hypothetical protein